MKISGKSAPSMTWAVCSGFTYRLPAPPTTRRRVFVPLKMSQRCFNEVLCCGSVSGVQAPNASITTSNPSRSFEVSSNRSFTIAFPAPERFSPRTTAVTSSPLASASSTISFPSFPFAQTTASFIKCTSISIVFICGLFLSAYRLIILL